VRAVLIGLFKFEAAGRGVCTCDSNGLPAATESGRVVFEQRSRHQRQDPGPAHDKTLFYQDTVGSCTIGAPSSERRMRHVEHLALRFWSSFGTQQGILADGVERVPSPRASRRRRRTPRLSAARPHAEREECS